MLKGTNDILRLEFQPYNIDINQHFRLVERRGTDLKNDKCSVSKTVLHFIHCDEMNRLFSAIPVCLLSLSESTPIGIPSLEVFVGYISSASRPG